jgi:hypothetical protein
VIHNKIRVSKDVLTSAEQLKDEMGFTNIRAAIEAVFRKFSPFYGKGFVLVAEQELEQLRQQAGIADSQIDCETAIAHPEIAEGMEAIEFSTTEGLGDK